MTETIGTTGHELIPPAPMMAGSFGIYDDGGGGYWLMVKLDGQDEVQRKHIPAKLIKLASSGPFARMAGGLFGT
jgi:hypothetical protein